MKDVYKYLNTRDEYIELIRSELLGPGSEITLPDAEHELITNAPDVRYSIGILFPRNNKMNADNDDSARPQESSEEEETEDVAEEVTEEAVEEAVEEVSEEAAEE